MNIFITLAMVGLLGVAMVYGEDSIRNDCCDGDRLSNLGIFKREYEKVIEESTLDASSSLEGFKKLKKWYFLIDSRIKKMRKDPLYGVQPTKNVGAPGVPVSGMSPEQITDPEVKEAYLAAIRKNDEAIDFQCRFMDLVNTQRTMRCLIECFLENNVKDQSLSKKLLKELPPPSTPQ